MKFSVYVIASSATSARDQHRQNVCHELQKEFEGSTVTVIEEFDADTITREVSQNHVKIEKLTDPRTEAFNKYTKPIDVRNLSNAMKHQSALKKIAEASEEPNTYNLVVEDDVLMGANWPSALRACVHEMPKDCDMVMLGIPGNSSERFQPASSVHEAIPCIDSYIVTKKAADTLSRSFFPVRFITNVHISYLAKTMNINIYLVKPNVFLDGTKYGSFVSTLTPGNQLFLNRDYVHAKAALSDNPAVNVPDKEVRALLYDTQLSGHPDFKHLQALFEWKTAGAESAVEKFKEAIALYDANNAMVTNESPALRDYIRLHKDLQALD